MNPLPRKRIHVGMDEMYKIVHQATYRFFGNDELYKLVMNEMYEIGRFIAKFEYEYSRICKSINFVLVVKPTLM